MKKTLLTLCAVALGAGAFAQTEKGHIVLGGSSNLGFTSGKQDNDADDATTNFGLNVAGGYFIMDNLAVGLLIGFESEKTGDVSASGFGIGPVVRYYLPMKVFGQLSYQFGSQKTDTGDFDFTYTTGDLGIGVGYAAFVNDHVAIEPMIAYHMTSAKPEEGDSVNGGSFGLNVGISVYLGD